MLLSKASQHYHKLQCERSNMTKVCVSKEVHGYVHAGHTVRH